MVELVVLLSEVIDVVGDECGAVVTTGIGNDGGEIGKFLNQRGLLLVGSHTADVLGLVVLTALAQYRLDAGIGVLDEGTGVAVEVDGLAGVEQHGLPGVHLKDEILQRTQANHAQHIVTLVLGDTLQAARLISHIGGSGNHLVHEFVGIDHSTLAGLHLTVGQLDHAIGEVYQILTPLEAQLVKQQREHLEVVVLLITHDINHAVDGIVLVTQLGGTDVLGHIDRRAVAAQQQLVVQAVGSEVSPHAIVFLAVEDALLEALEHGVASHQIGVALVVDFVEGNTHALVGLVKAGIYPVVHLLPQGANLGVTSLPATQHVVCLLDEGCLLLGLFRTHTLLDEFLDFGLIVLVKCHIEVANQVVALLAGRFGCCAIAPLEPSKHRLADVDTAVVDDIGLDHLVTVGLHNLGEAVAQQVVAYVAQVQRLVGVGRGVLNHHQLAIITGCREAVVGRFGNVLQHTSPERRLDGDVQEALDDVEFLYCLAVSQHVLTDFLCSHIWRLAGRLQEREHHNRLIALKFLLGRLGNNLLSGKVHAIQLLYRHRGSLCKYIINRHNLLVFKPLIFSH